MKEFFRRHPQWAAVVEIAQRLQGQNHRAVLAGGCVRDALLGRKPNDLDVATSATPDQIEQIFERVVPVGKAFGVCRVVIGGESLEVATFREEDDYKDGRRPEKVVYSTLEKDALRRDFTVNAMFFDLATEELIDLVDGQEDLHEKLIRTVGDPRKRFAEDHLRILRAVRFAAQLDFKIEEKTFQAMRELAYTVEKISQERITDELRKGLMSRDAAAFLESLRGLGLSRKWIQGGVDLEFHRKFFSPPITEESLAWALLTWENYSQRWQEWGAVQKALGESLELCKKLKLSNEVIARVRVILEAGVLGFAGKQDGLGRFVKAAQSGVLTLIEEFWSRWGKASGEMKPADKIARYKAEHMENGNLPAPLVESADLLQLNIQPGPEFGKLLEQSYLYQLEKNIRDKRELLAIIAKN